MDEKRKKLYRKPLGKKLKEWRCRKNLSQSEVSQRLGYSSPQFISNWERGVASPPLLILASLAKIYEVSPNTVINFLLKLEKKVLQSLIENPTQKN